MIDSHHLFFVWRLFRCYLHAEKVVSKETSDEVNRLGSVLGEGSLRALCTIVSKDPNILKVFTSVLLKSEGTVQVTKDILKVYGK